MEKYGSSEHRRNTAIEKVVAAAIVVALSCAYKGCKGQELHELLKQKTEQIDRDPSDTGVIASHGKEHLFIDYRDQDSVKVYTYVAQSPEHNMSYQIKSNEKDGHGQIDGKPIDSQTAIYALNKQLGEIVKTKDLPNIY